MTIDIGEPDPESRMAIVKKKAANHGVLLSNEVVEYVATSMSGSIRELEGMVNSIICNAQVKGFAPDIAEVRQSLRSFTRPQKNISVKNIVDKVAEYYGIDEESIYEKHEEGRWYYHGKSLCIFSGRILVFLTLLSVQNLEDVITRQLSTLVRR